MLNSYKQRCKWKIIEAGMLPPKTVKTRSCTHRDGGAKGAEYRCSSKGKYLGAMPPPTKALATSAEGGKI